MKNYKEELKAALDAQRDMGMKGDNWDNYAVARSVMREDIDENSQMPPYDLDEERRDRLLAHARQDASHALANTVSLLRRVRWLTWMVYLLLVVAVWREFGRWPH